MTIWFSLWHVPGSLANHNTVWQSTRLPRCSIRDTAKIFRQALHLRVLFLKIQIRPRSCWWRTWVWIAKQLCNVPEGKQNGHDIWHILCYKTKKCPLKTHVHCASKLECKFRNTFTPILYLVEVASFWLICLFMEQKHV